MFSRKSLVALSFSVCMLSMSLAPLSMGRAESIFEYSSSFSPKTFEYFRKILIKFPPSHPLAKETLFKLGCLVNFGDSFSGISVLRSIADSGDYNVFYRDYPYGVLGMLVSNPSHASRLAMIVLMSAGADINMESKYGRRTPVSFAKIAHGIISKKDGTFLVSKTQGLRDLAQLLAFGIADREYLEKASEKISFSEFNERLKKPAVGGSNLYFSNQCQDKRIVNYLHNLNGEHGKKIVEYAGTAGDSDDFTLYSYFKSYVSEFSTTEECENKFASLRKSFKDLAQQFMDPNQIQLEMNSQRTGEIRIGELGTKEVESPYFRLFFIN